MKVSKKMKKALPLIFGSMFVLSTASIGSAAQIIESIFLHKNCGTSTGLILEKFRFSH